MHSPRHRGWSELHSSGRADRPPRATDPIGAYGHIPGRGDWAITLTHGHDNLEYSAPEPSALREKKWGGLRTVAVALQAVRR